MIIQNIKSTYLRSHKVTKKNARCNISWGNFSPLRLSACVCLPGGRRGRDGQNGHKKNQRCVSRRASGDEYKYTSIHYRINIKICVVQRYEKNVLSATGCRIFLSFRLSAWEQERARRAKRAKKQRSVSRRTSETMKTDMTVSHIKIIMSKNLLSLQSYNKFIPYAIIFGGIIFPPPSGADKRRVRRVSAKKTEVRLTTHLWNQFISWKYDCKSYQRKLCQKNYLTAKLQ